MSQVFLEYEMNGRAKKVSHQVLRPGGYCFNTIGLKQFHVSSTHYKQANPYISIPELTTSFHNPNMHTNNLRF